MVTRVTLATILVVLAVAPAPVQERFSFFQASTPESVERMLRLADLRDDDVVVDLGSGNGLIPLTAARMNSRLRGRGVDINPQPGGGIQPDGQEPGGRAIACVSSIATPSTTICATRLL